MIINSKNYSGACECGKTHQMETEFCVIESGALKNIDTYLNEYNISGYSVAIYDENTYEATKGLYPKTNKQIILSPENLHADNHGIALAFEQVPKNCDYLIAVGSGTIHDITRYIAYELNIPFVSCPTAASVDGFCSSVAALTWDGYKKTFTAVAPKIVVADLDVISNAPMFLTNSGFGDMIGKFIALSDWKIANILTGEYFCKTIYDMTLNATKSVVDSAKQIKTGDVSAYEKLIYGLLMSGLAMQLLGNSRCASGAEHHISHIIEMQPDGLDVCSDALHGEKVGVGTLIASKVYHDVVNSNIEWNDYIEIDFADVKNMFGDRLIESIETENKVDSIKTITAKLLNDNFDKIKDVINGIPTYDELLAIYNMLGVKSTLEDIEVDDSKLPLIIKYSPYVRNRLTLMRLLRLTK